MIARRVSRSFRGRFGRGPSGFRERTRSPRGDDPRPRIWKLAPMAPAASSASPLQRMDDDLRRILGHEDAGYGRADEAPPAQDQDLLVLQVQEPCLASGARRRSRQIDEREKTRQLLAREPSRAAGREPASVRNAKRVRTSRSTRPRTLDDPPHLALPPLVQNEFQRAPFTPALDDARGTELFALPRGRFRAGPLPSGGARRAGPASRHGTRAPPPSGGGSGDGQAVRVSSGAAIPPYRCPGDRRRSGAPPGGSCTRSYTVGRPRASDRAVRYPAGLFSATTIAAAGAESAKLAVILRPLRRTSSAPGSTDVPVAVTTRPLTCTSPAAIRSSLFRLDATPACARKRWSLTASPLLQRQLLLALAIGEQDLELVGTR